MAISNTTKQNIVKKYGKSDKDCGSSEVQIALLTENINNLTNHFSDNKKDIHSRRGLLKMVGKRKKLLSFLKAKSLEKYQNLIKTLGLRH